MSYKFHDFYVIVEDILKREGERQSMVLLSVVIQMRI